MGEGEKHLNNCYDDVHGEIPLEEVPGIAYLQDGKMNIHPQPKKIDLRELPSPFRFEEDRASYFKTRSIY